MAKIIASNQGIDCLIYVRDIEDYLTIKALFYGVKLEDLTNTTTLSLECIEIGKQEYSALDALVVLNSANLLSPGYINSSITPYNIYLGYTSTSNLRINSLLLPAKYTKGNIRELTSI